MVNSFFCSFVCAFYFYNAIKAFASGKSRKSLCEVDRLNNIVGNLLSLAQPAESNPEEINILQEIERCLNFIGAKAKSQNVKLQTDFENNFSATGTNYALTHPGTFL